MVEEISESMDIISKYIILLLDKTEGLTRLKIECMIFLLSQEIPELDQALKNERIHFSFTNEVYLNRGEKKMRKEKRRDRRKYKRAIKKGLPEHLKKMRELAIDEASKTAEEQPLVCPTCKGQDIVLISESNKQWWCNKCKELFLDLF